MELISKYKQEERKKIIVVYERRKRRKGRERDRIESKRKEEKKIYQGYRQSTSKK